MSDPKLNDYKPEANNLLGDKNEARTPTQRSIAVDKKKEFICGICDYTVETGQALKMHQEMEHDGVKKSCHKCQYCPYSSETEGFLKSHIIKVHKLKPEYNFDPSRSVYKCSVCSFETMYKGSISSHMTKGKHHLTARGYSFESGYYTCEYCDFKCNHSSSIKRHVNLGHHGTTYKCEKCDFSTGYTYMLQNHVVNSHELRQDLMEGSSKEHVPSPKGMRMPEYNFDPSRSVYKCSVCSFETGYKASILRHKHHKGKGGYSFESDYYNCEYCNFKTSHLSSIRTHVNKGHHGTQYKCERCDFLTGYSYMLQDHVVYSHTLRREPVAHVVPQSSSMKYVPCPQCQEFLDDEDKLAEHINLQHSM